MCDYSLMAIPNRLATEGEELVVHRFHTGSLGFKSPPPPCGGWWGLVRACFSTKPPTVICIPPGAHLMLRDIPAALQAELGVASQEEVVFTQISPAANRYRDAVRFANGKQALLQRLHKGQRTRVLSLSSADDVRRPFHQEAESSFRLVRSH